MSKQCNRNLPRAISVADYILEGHSVAEAAKEFGYAKATIERDINLLGAIAFYGNESNEKELKIKYYKVRKTLKELANEARSKAARKKGSC